jgi:hypothetical protein
MGDVEARPEIIQDVPERVQAHDRPRRIHEAAGTQQEDGRVVFGEASLDASDGLASATARCGVLDFGVDGTRPTRHARR